MLAHYFRHWSGSWLTVDTYSLHALEQGVTLLWSRLTTGAANLATSLTREARPAAPSSCGIMWRQQVPQVVMWQQWQPPCPGARLQ